MTFLLAGVPATLASRVFSTCDDLMEEIQLEREEDLESQYDKLKSRGMGLFGMSPEGKKEKKREREELKMAGKCRDLRGGDTALHTLSELPVVEAAPPPAAAGIRRSQTNEFPPFVEYTEELMVEAIDALVLDGADPNAFNAEVSRKEKGREKRQESAFPFTFSAFSSFS